MCYRNPNFNDILAKALERQERKHLEMIIDYIVDGDDFQYSDNHGVLIRCKDCKHYHKDKDNIPFCNSGYGFQADDYCSKAEKREG